MLALVSLFQHYGQVRGRIIRAALLRLHEVGDANGGMGGSMERNRLFDLLCGMLGARGRDDALFGGDLDAARGAFCRMTPDASLIHAYFEMPLQGDPGFDVHCAVTCEQVETTLDVEAGGAWHNALAWFCDAGPFLTADEAFLMAEADTSAGCSMQSGMYLIQGARKDLVEPFLNVVGEHVLLVHTQRRTLVHDSLDLAIFDALVDLADLESGYLWNPPRLSGELPARTKFLMITHLVEAATSAPNTYRYVLQKLEDASAEAIRD